MGKKIRVLLVDDEPDMLDVVKQSIIVRLKPAEFDFTCIDQSSEAIKIYRPGMFDIVILDYQMPKYTGVDVAAAIRSLDKRQVLAILTANTIEVEKELENRDFEGAYPAVFAKPAKDTFLEFVECMALLVDFDDKDEKLDIL